MSSASNPLSYESPSAGREDVFWRAFRFAVIAWSAVVLVRHGSYWTIEGRRLVAWDRGVVLLAAVECAMLATILVAAVRVRPVSAKGRSPMAWACVVYLIAAMTTLGLDTAHSFGLRSSVRPDALRLTWVIASRVQIWIIPAMVIYAWALSRRERRAGAIDER